MKKSWICPGQKVRELLYQVAVILEQHRHLLVHLVDGLVAFTVHVENLQKRLVHMFFV